MQSKLIKSVIWTSLWTISGLGSAAALAQDVTGAGATFPAPIYSKWAAEYNKVTGRKVNYQSVGSGAGIKQIDAKTVDFGALGPHQLEALTPNSIIFEVGTADYVEDRFRLAPGDSQRSDAASE